MSVAANSNYKQTIFLKAVSLHPDHYGSDGELEDYVASECKKLPHHKTTFFMLKLFYILRRVKWTTLLVSPVCPGQNQKGNARSSCST